MSQVLKKKLILFFIVISSLFLGMSGGVVRIHLDSEFSQTLQNKTYFLHAIYQGFSSIELKIRQLYFREDANLTTIEFMQKNSQTAISLYLVASIFCIIGILACYFTGKKLFGEAEGLVSALILGTSFMWSTYLHYPTVDLPVTALCALCYLAMISSRSLDFYDRLLIAVLLGMAIITKYAGAFLLVPFLILYYDPIDLKKTFLDLGFMIVTSLGIFAYFMLGKISVIDQTIINEYEALFNSGFIGFENKNGHTFIYHLQHTLGTEFGLLSSLFAIVGIFYAKKKLDPRIFWSLVSFPLVIYLIMGSMMLENPRYIMPMIPFVAVLSGLGIVSTSELIATRLKLPKSILICVLSVACVAWGINMTWYHNSLLAKPGTEKNLGKLLNSLKPNVNEIIYQPLLRFLPYGFRNIKHRKNKNLLDCNSQKHINVKKLFFKNPKNILAIDSFWTDSFVYDWHFQCPDSSRRAFKNFEDLELFIISPFSIPKEKVPYSHESIFSPKPPDLFFRKSNGLYYEYFILDKSLANEFEKKAKKLKIDYRRTQGKKSFYFNKIQGYVE
jgi:hypothetical protein